MMRKMINVTSDRQSRRMQADREELAERIACAMPRDGVVEVQPGLHLYRRSKPTERVHASCQPAFCVIAQGRKVVELGEDSYQYDPAHYLIATMAVPLTGEVVEASPQRPYLSLRLVLDPSVATSVMVESGFAVARGDAGVKAIDVSPLDANLLDATLRLVRLIETPNAYRVLAPLVVREILYRLLTGAQHSRMRHLATFGGQAHRMVRAVEKLRDKFDKPLRIEDLARELGMSISGFHAHFKAVAAMSPLQFQKHLRLQEARRLMLNEKLDAAEAGYRVGYDDASHFSREYKRHFGEPPMRNVERLRGRSGASASQQRA
jgi:AraC-like DNA-binding protein